MFLPVATREYLSADYRVMVVGQETKGWNGRLVTLIQAHSGGCIDNYIDSAVAVYTRCRYRKAGKSRFMQFLKGVETKLVVPPHSVHWANLFACDYKGRSPLQAPDVDLLKELSLQLLKLQIAELKPDAILFTTGPRYHRYMKALFEDYMQSYNDPRVLSRRNGLGKATLFSCSSGGIPCYRTTHPRYVRDARFRNQAIKALVEHMKAILPNIPNHFEKCR